jgi:transcriptional regulator with XRE-family HTH domain
MATKKPTPAQTVRNNLRRAAEESGMTLEEIGLRMGFARGGARQAVSRLLNQEGDYDPRLSTIISFAEALDLPLQELVASP